MLILGGIVDLQEPEPIDNRVFGGFFGTKSLGAAERAGSVLGMRGRCLLDFSNGEEGL